MTATVCNTASSYISELNDVLARTDANRIEEAAARVFQSWLDERQIITFGNGGSALTASHFVTDLVKTAAVEGMRRVRAMCLSDNVGLLTAIGNDLSYEHSFVYSMESYARATDVAIAISASGNSPNVVAACRWAKENDMTVIALTGFTGGRIADLADIHVNAPSSNYGVIEDVHMSVGHMVCQILRHRISCYGATT